MGGEGEIVSDLGGKFIQKIYLVEGVRQKLRKERLKKVLKVKLDKCSK